MATTTAASSGDELSITVEPTAHADAGGGEVRQSESIVSASMVRKKMERLNTIVFCVAMFEWAGNAVGTLAFLWATVVLLGGFSSLLSGMDFWFATAMVFVEGSRVFIRNDASVNQWLFGSTRAFRWENFSFPRMLLRPKYGNIIAVIIGVGITLVPIDIIHPQIAKAEGILKVVLLIIISQLLARLRDGWFAYIALLFLLSAAVCGGIFGLYRMQPHKRVRGFKDELPKLTFTALVLACTYGVAFLAVLVASVLSRIPFMRKPIPLLCFKVVIALVLACLPFLQAKLASYYYRFFSIAVAVVLLILSNHEHWQEFLGENDIFSEQNDSFSDIPEQNNTRLLFQILETILPILFFWSVMFPLPGISLKISFYMLFSVIAAVLVANLQIPVAFLQVLLSIMRLHSLLGHHHHDYHPLPDGASPNLVPSIVIFFMLELCQGSSYIMAVILGVVSLLRRRSLVRDLEFQQEWWGPKVVDLYHHQAYQTRTERGLFPSEKHTPSLTGFAINSLGSNSSEMQIVGLHLLHNFLERWDSESKRELITQITYASKKAVPTMIDMLGSTAAQHQDIRLLAAEIINKLSGSLRISEFPGMVKLISSLLDAENRQDYSMLNHVPAENNGGNDDIELRQLIIERWMRFYLLGLSILENLAFDPDNCTEIAKDATNIITKVIRLVSYLTNENNTGESEQQAEKEMVYESALKFVRRFATIGGKTGARFRHELSENALLLNSLDRILDISKPELRELVIDIIGKLALDEATKQEIGSTQPIIHKLMDELLRPDGDVNPSENSNCSLRLTAGEALVNLTIRSTDNCWAILLAEPGHNLIENLTSMLENEHYICVAANLLNNLCANSRDKLIDLGAHVHLESALTKVMQIIRTKEGKQLEAALCVASQIGYVIPEYFARTLDSDTGAAAELVEKLVDTLNSHREPCLEYPRIRRVLVEVVISIVDLCPGYIKIFREKGLKDALDMVKGTPSRCEKYRFFLNGEGVVSESIPMRDLVDKAKRLIHQATPSLGA